MTQTVNMTTGIDASSMTTTTTREGDTENKYPFRPAGENDSRSPCPALNALANHGYLPHDGKNLTPAQLAHGLEKAYNLSAPLAWFLSIVGVWVCGHFSLSLLSPRRLHLHELARHNRIEHDASLAHADAEPGQKFAPIAVDEGLFDALMRDASIMEEAAGRPSDETAVDPTAQVDADAEKATESEHPSSSSDEVANGHTDTNANANSNSNPETNRHADTARFTKADLVRVRVRRNLSLAQQLDAVHAEISRGELSMTIQTFGRAFNGALASYSGSSPSISTSPQLTSASNTTPQRDPPKQSTTKPSPIPDDISAPREWLRVWFGEDRLPIAEGWTKPTSKVGLLPTVKLSRWFESAVNAAQGSSLSKGRGKAKVLGSEKKASISRSRRFGILSKGKNTPPAVTATASSNGRQSTTGAGANV